MNMMDKFNCDIMNVNDIHEKQNDNFDTFEKEDISEKLETAKNNKHIKTLK